MLKKESNAVNEIESLRVLVFSVVLCFVLCCCVVCVFALCLLLLSNQNRTILLKEERSVVASTTCPQSKPHPNNSLANASSLSSPNRDDCQE